MAIFTEDQENHLPSSSGSIATSKNSFAFLRFSSMNILSCLMRSMQSSDLAGE